MSGTEPASTGQPTRQPTEQRHAEAVRRLATAVGRTAVVPVLLTVAIGAGLAAVLVGAAGLAGALAGGAVAVASSLLTLAMMRFSADLPVQLVMAVALGGYLLKVLALLAVMVALRGVEALHPLSLALTMLATVLVWAVAELVAFKRTRIPTIVVDTV